MSATVVFYAVTDARSDFIGMQARTIAMFGCRASLVVVNNAPQGAVRDEIRREAAHYGCRCIDVPVGAQIRETPNWAHASALTWLWHEIIVTERPDYAVLFDFDMFLIAPFDVAAYLGDAIIAGQPQSRPYDQPAETLYFWPGLLVFHLARMESPELVDLSCGSVGGVSVDVGGMLHYYLVAYHVKTKAIPTTRDIAPYLPDRLTASYDPEFHCDVFASGAAFHYSRGTNWDYRDGDYMARKTAWVREFIEDRLNQHREPSHGSP